MNPLNTLTLYSFPTLSSFVSKTEEQKDGTAPNEISRLLGHLSRRNFKCKYQERLSRGWR